MLVKRLKPLPFLSGTSLMERQQVAAFSRDLIQDSQGFVAFAVQDQRGNVASGFLRKGGPKADARWLRAEAGGPVEPLKDFLPFDLDLAQSAS